MRPSNQKLLLLSFLLSAAILTAVAAWRHAWLGLDRYRNLRHSSQQPILDATPLTLGESGIFIAPFRVARQSLRPRFYPVLSPETAEISGENQSELAQLQRFQREFGTLSGTITLFARPYQRVCEIPLVPQYRFPGGQRYLTLGALPSLPPGDYLFKLAWTRPAALAQPDIQPPTYQLSLAHLAGNTLSLAVLTHALLATLLAIIALLFLKPSLSILIRLRFQRRLEKWHEQGKGNGKILYLLTSYPRWSETFVRQDLALLQSSGLPIHPVALFPGDCALQDDWPQVKVLTSSNTPTGQEKTVSPRWKALVHAVLPKALNARISLLRHHKLLWKLLAEAWNTPACQIHAEFADLGALLAVKVARRLQIPYSISIHAFDAHSCKYPEARLLGQAAFITVCNESAAQALRQHCPGLDHKVRLIHHGLILQDWPYQTARTPQNPPRLLFVGRLVPKKGIDILLRALAILHQNSLPATLQIIGSGPLHDPLQQLAAELGLADAVAWHGRLSRDEVRQCLLASDCLCAPSIVDRNGDRDGIPNVIVEAMASGVPVVGSQAGGLGELLHADTGWPLHRLTPETLAHALQEMHAAPDECERRRLNGRRHVEQDFDAVQLARQRARLFF